MALDNFQAQVANLYDTRELDLTDPLGYRDRNAADASTTITVFEAGTTTPVTTYPTDDENGTPNANPFNTDTEGNFIFYAEQGIRVDVIVNYAPLSADNRGWYDVAIGSNLTDINDRIGNIESEIANLPTEELVDEVIDDALNDFGGNLRSYQEQLVGDINDILIRNQEDLNSQERDRVLRTDIFRLEASLNGNLAAITRIDRVLVTNEQALAENLVLIEARFNDNESRIVSNQQAISNEVEARTQSFNSINARVSDAEATITQTQLALTNETEARASSIQQLESSLGQTNATVTNVQQAIVTESETRATAVQQLNAADLAQISSINLVRSTSDGNSEAITALNGRVNDETTGLEASYDLALQATNELNEVSAVALLQVQANGRPALFQLGATPDFSQIILRGDELLVQDTSGANAIVFDTVNDWYTFRGRGQFNRGIDAVYNNSSCTVGLPVSGSGTAPGAELSSGPSRVTVRNNLVLDLYVNNNSNIILQNTGVGILNGALLQNSMNASVQSAINNIGATRFDIVSGRQTFEGTTVTIGGDLYVTGSILPHTAAHRVAVSFEHAKLIEVGDLVVETKLIDRADISNALFEGELATEKGQVNVLGAAVKIREISISSGSEEIGVTKEWAEKNLLDYGILIANATGDGLVNVCGRGGNLKAGDLIIASDLRGKGERQPDDIVRSNTVAKCREDVNFDHPDQVKLIAVKYICG